MKPTQSVVETEDSHISTKALIMMVFLGWMLLFGSSFEVIVTVLWL